MDRKIFFSFHFERDAWRAGQVRNSDIIPNHNETGFTDVAEWEEIKQQGKDAIKKWILKQLEGTSVTVVLIGAETAQREWIDFEIRESWERGNAIIGLHIHNIKDQEQKTDKQGINPLDNVSLKDGTALSAVCSTYDWVTNDGRKNLGTWADQAVKEQTAYKGEKSLKQNQQASTPSHPTVISNPSAPWAY